MAALLAAWPSRLAFFRLVAGTVCDRLPLRWDYAGFAIRRRRLRTIRLVAASLVGRKLLGGKADIAVGDLVTHVVGLP